MNLRKEPVLFVVVLLLAAWIWTNRDLPNFPRVANSPEAAYTAPDVVPVVLAGAGGPGMLPEDDLFREPTEAVPLPPRPLPPPDLAPLPVLAPPLLIGPEAGAFYVLREPGGAPQPHAFRGGSESGSDDELDGDPGTGGAVAADGGLTGGGATQDPASSRIPEEVLIQRFDRVWVEGTRNPFYGTIKNTDKLELFERNDTLPEIVMDVVSSRDGRVVQINAKIQDAERLALADSLENRIALRKRKIPSGPAGERDRVAFLGDLLRDASENPWVFQEAEAQAQLLLESTGGSLLGYRWLVRTIRAQGDLSREWELYQNLPPALADTAARWREQGRLEAGLTLWVDAEKHLRQAVDMAPGDARSQAALAQFLLERGRAAEARPHAEATISNLGTVFPEVDRSSLIRAAVATFLALGDFDTAQQASYRLGAWSDPADQAYLLGCVEYARAGLAEDEAGRRAGLAKAGEQFETAAAEARRLDALLGLGCTKARLQQWDQAHALLLRVHDEAPALRARTLAALGYLYERTDNADRARDALAAAELADPSDPYVLYMAARQRRLAGDPAGALDTLRRALSERDDLTEAFGEVTHALLQRADTEDGSSSLLLANAARFVDRLVLLDSTRGRYVPYLELQGHVMARVGDIAEARRAFRAAAAGGSDFADLSLCLLDYRSKRVTQARQGLASIESDPGRKPATRDFARATLLLIDDHASKELVRDDFDRDRLGGFWRREGRINFTEPLAGRLLLRGDSGAGGSQESTIERKAIPAGNLLSFAATMQVTGSTASLSYAGLHIRVVSGAASQRAFQVDLGLRNRSSGLRPELFIQDGRGEGDEQIIDLAGEVGRIDPTQPQQLEMELVPASTATAVETNRRFALVVRWNGVEVQRIDPIKSLRPNSRGDLVTAFQVKGNGIEVAFDDYRLERRREQ